MSAPSPVFVTSISRPKRIAFLFNPATSSVDDIDHLIDFSQRCWGGRYFCFIPTDGNSIAPDWWSLLEMVDPDYVHALHPLSDSLIARINRRVAPALISEVCEKQTRVTPDIDLLGIGDIPRFEGSKRGWFSDNFFAYFKRAPSGTNHTRFFRRNFGLLSDDIGTEMCFRDVPHLVIEEKGLTPEEFFTQRLAEKRHVAPIFPKELCRLSAWPNFTVAANSFDKGLHIVVGEDPLDAAYLWNTVFLMDAWHAPAVYWLPTSALENEELLKLLKQWIERTFWQGDERFGKIISYSVAKERLQSLPGRLKNGACRGFEVHQMPPDKFPLGKWSSPGRLYSEHELSRSELISISTDGGQMPFVAPPFVHERQHRGGWMVDLAIQYRPEQYDWTNQRPIWELPTRPGVSHLLVTRFRDSRPSREYSVSAAVKATEQSVPIQIPSDRMLLSACMFPMFGNFELRREPPRSCFCEIQTSAGGRYLRGLIQLFGNLYSAGRTFEDPFWRNVILEMAGRPEDDFNRRRERLLKPLRQLLAECEAEGKPVTSTREDLADIAGKLVNSLTLFEPEPKPLTLTILEERFRELRNESIRLKRDEDWWKVHTNAQEHIERDLSWLLERGVFFNGTELRCDVCGSKRWYPVDDMKPRTRCGACLEDFSLPAAPEWSLSLNSLVGNAVRRHGLLAVLQALYSLERFANSFIFVPSQDLFEEGNPEQFTDLDLLIIREGRLIFGEVKSSPNGLLKLDFEKLEIVARELVPDEILLAAAGDEWPAPVWDKIQALAKALEPLEIAVTAKLLHW